MRKLGLRATFVRLQSFLTIVVSVLVLSAFAQDVQPRRPLLEVIQTDWQVRTSTTIVYVRVFSDGSTEAHDLRRLDLRDVHLTSRKLDENTFTTLRAMLHSDWVKTLPPKQGPFYGETDSGQVWHLTIYGERNPYQLQMVNFNPYVTMYRARKPYPSELEKFVCLLWKVRREAVNDVDYGAVGCMKFETTSDFVKPETPSHK